MVSHDSLLIIRKMAGGPSLHHICTDLWLCTGHRGSHDKCGSTHWSVRRWVSGEGICTSMGCILSDFFKFLIVHLEMFQKNNFWFTIQFLISNHLAQSPMILFSGTVRNLLPKSTILSLLVFFFFKMHKPVWQVIIRYGYSQMYA